MIVIKDVSGRVVIKEHKSQQSISIGMTTQFSLIPRHAKYVQPEKRWPSSKELEDDEVYQYYRIAMNSRTWSFAIFQCASAAMLGGAVLSALIAASIALGGQSAWSILYSASLSSAICTVAFVNYSAMTTRRITTLKECRAMASKTMERPITKKCAIADDMDQFEVTCLRYSDWIITMPLLALELFHLATDGPCPLHEGLLTSIYVYAIISVISICMIVSGFIALVAVGDFDSLVYDTGKLSIWRWGLYLIGAGCLGFLYYILFNATNQTDSVHRNEVMGFSLIWIAYPIVFIMQMRRWLNGAQRDLLFALLDILSKPLLAVYILQCAIVRADGSFTMPDCVAN